MGKLDYAKEAIDRASDVGIHVLKFQFFKNPENYTGGNVELPKEWWPELLDYSKGKIPITASVFDLESLVYYLSFKPLFVKLAYSKKGQNDWIERSLSCETQTIVSCDPLTDRSIDRRTRRLYCIPEYPVRYEVAFDGLFPRFHGFSDHTLGTRQTLRAIDAGASIIEKHMKLDHNDVTCPDAGFALSPHEFKSIIKLANG